ncbi:MAG: hypothetical protein B9S33_16820 [Pedosphaera sp. Tous-C6FEB]|nr:MAG: hypothetical protein B9S33_16820 [Pedosphaera sp. Tous-C6FEB]
MGRVLANSRADCKASPPLEAFLREEIARTGPVSFARFMEVALYLPEHGYYERSSKVVGRRGDFYTSVSVGRLFGELLAFQASEWLDELAARNPDRGPRQIVEAGAHDGQLAEDMLNWLQRSRPDLWEHLEYWIIEPSARRRAWQEDRLKTFAPKVRWFNAWAELPAASVSGVIFANELLDAFPVHRLAWSQATQEWREWGVTSVEAGFQWTYLPKLHPAVAELADPAAALGDMDVGERRAAWQAIAPLLPDGFIIERAPTALHWWTAAARSLGHGWLWTLDYGHRSGAALHPAKPQGTLRAYRDHQLVEDLLAALGTQDLTAHVDFSAVARAGEESGLATVGLTDQSSFFSNLARKAMQSPATFGEWTRERTRQFQTLTHPDHLGRSFAALVQARA